MYKQSAGVCAVCCFLVVVMVAALSSCGCALRIEEGDYRATAMGARIIARGAGRESERTGTGASVHRLRHSRHSVRMRSVATPPSQYYAQIPAPAQPTAAAASRWRRRRRSKTCQEQNLARKAVLANTVVLAKAESMSADRVRNYSVSFRILKKFKTPDDRIVDDNLRLMFLNDTRRMNCESEMRRGLTKAQIRQSKEYYLFLNSQGGHNYTVVGMPVLHRRRKQADTEKILRNVTRRTFAPTLRKPEVHNDTKQPRQRVRLVCRAKGNPIPVIRWKKDDTFLNSTSKIRITYRGRQSTLVIKRAEDGDSGHYTCIAQGVDRVEKEASLWISNKEKCKDDAYCLNGGTCKYNKVLDEHICVCSDGYKGIRCAQKSIEDLAPVQSYMYYDDVV